MWELEFFEKDNAECPINEFINDQPPKDQVLIQRGFSLLAEYGNALRRPHTDYLDDGLWELRVRVIKKQYRFIFFYYQRQIIVVTHGFLKKESVVPRKEIKLAQTYRDIYINRMESK